MRREQYLACLVFVAATRIASAYDGQVVNDQGNAVANATIAVAATSAPGTLAAIFDLDGAAKPNPFSANAEGHYSFSAAPGDYNIAISAPGFSTALVGVGVADPSGPHAIAGDDDQAPLTLVESDTVATAGNAALALERRRSDGTPLAGPWSLHVNQGPAPRKTDFLWLYNVDWNEAKQERSPLLTADAGFALDFKPGSVGPPDSPQHTADQQRFSFAYDYTPPRPAGSKPTWTTILQDSEASFDTIGTMRVVRIGAGPFVISDGLENSSLEARRVGWGTFHTTAPAGVLSPVVDPQPAMDPGDVAIPISVNPYPGAAPATEHAQLDATVFLRSGNGSPPTLLTVGKALVRVASGTVASPGDVVVSSGTQPGRAAVDNSVTEPRRTIGLALEPVGATLPGYLAIVRTAR
jgi:hypothetical protein